MFLQAQRLCYDLLYRLISKIFNYLKKTFVIDKKNKGIMFNTFTVHISNLYRSEAWQYTFIIFFCDVYFLLYLRYIDLPKNFNTIQIKKTNTYIKLWTRSELMSTLQWYAADSNMRPHKIKNIISNYIWDNIFYL